MQVLHQIRTEIKLNRKRGEEEQLLPMGSTTISIPEAERVTTKDRKSHSSFISLTKEKNIKYDDKKLIHSIKVGIALVAVSLLFLLDPLYKRAGDNSMWAVMTVVVVFEFHAGATLGKGLNRGLGTILGGGLGCLAAVLAEEAGRIGHAIIVATSVFVFGMAATYARLIPRIKKRYDYGAMIFILTFNLVLVSGVRAEEVITLARDRLFTILTGFIVCIFTSLVIFPVWASDEFHSSTVSKFESLATSIEGCLEVYLKSVVEMENQHVANDSNCKQVLFSKSKDESLANFARWEPWHGKFGFFYPWEKHLKIGELLREQATYILMMNSCVHSLVQPYSSTRESMKDSFEAIGSSLTWTLRELGQSIAQMKRCQREALITPELKSIRQELSFLTSSSKLQIREEVAIASLFFLLLDMVEKMEELAKEVEELGELAGFLQ